MTKYQPTSITVCVLKTSTDGILALNITDVGQHHGSACYRQASDLEFSYTCIMMPKTRPAVEPACCAYKVELSVEEFCNVSTSDTCLCVGPHDVTTATDETKLYMCSTHMGQQAAP